MAVNHAEGPILLEVSVDGNGDYLVEARFNGSSSLITSATNADRSTALANCITALDTVFPWSDSDTGITLSTLPLMVVNKVSDYRTR